MRKLMILLVLGSVCGFSKPPQVTDSIQAPRFNAEIKALLSADDHFLQKSTNTWVDYQRQTASQTRPGEFAAAAASIFLSL